MYRAREDVYRDLRLRALFFGMGKRYWLENKGTPVPGVNTLYSIASGTCWTARYKDSVFYREFIQEFLIAS
jgi:hypothetical protein